MKAVLLIDMPKSCADCKYCGFEQFTKKSACVICEGNFDIDEDIENERSAICPLRPLPEKKNVAVEDIEDIMHTEFLLDSLIAKIHLDTDKLIALGWNSCVDEILGEKE